MNQNNVLSHNCVFTSKYTLQSTDDDRTIESTVVCEFQLLKSCIIQAENVIEHVEASLRCWHQMEHLTELEGVLLARELKVAGDENEHPAGGAGRLAVHGGDVVLTLVEGQSGELGDDVLRSHDFLALESQHGSILVQIRQPGPIGIEG